MLHVTWKNKALCFLLESFQHSDICLVQKASFFGLSAQLSSQDCPQLTPVPHDLRLEFISAAIVNIKVR